MKSSFSFPRLPSVGCQKSVQGWQLSLRAQHQQRALCLTAARPAWVFLATFLLPAPERFFLVLAIIPNFQAFAWRSSARIAMMLESLVETQ